MLKPPARYWRARLMGLVVAVWSLPLWANEWSLPATFWLQPRSAERVQQQADVQAAVAALLVSPAAVLRVHHAPGDEAALQAAELRYWLISLAIASERIELRADLLPAQPIKLEIYNKVNS